MIDAFATWEIHDTTRAMLAMWPVRVTVSGAPLTIDLNRERPTTIDEHATRVWDNHSYAVQSDPYGYESCERECCVGVDE